MNSKVKKLTKSELNKFYSSLSYVIGDSSGAVGKDENLRAKERIHIRAGEMMDALKLPLNYHAKTLVLQCESLIDRATTRTNWIAERYPESPNNQELKPLVSPPKLTIVR